MFWKIKNYFLPVVFLSCLVAAVGCNPKRPVYFRGDGSLSHYIEKATDIEYPDVDTTPLDEVTQAHAPFTVMTSKFDSFWDLSLEESISTALQNQKLIRGYGTPGLQGNLIAPGQDSLTNGTAVAGSLYDVAIRQSEAGSLGVPGQIATPGLIPTNTGLDVNQGVEAALAQFDAQYTSNFVWSTTDRPRNANLNSNNNFFTQSEWSWTNQLAKQAANGSQFFLRNVNGYTRNNLPPSLQALSSVYSSSLEAEWRQPLLRGRGTLITRMPVIFARISSDQEIANLESQLQNMVCNVEIRYWELYAAYRSFQAAKEGRDAALTTWRVTKERLKEGGALPEEAQAREQYGFFDAQLKEAKSNLLNAENQLRWLMGVSSTDGRLIRPLDEPSEASVSFDWCTALDETLSFRPRLRFARWELKKKELAVSHAKNGLLPTLNLSAMYRFVGLGDDFGATNSPGVQFPAVGSDAWDSLTSGDFQEGRLGLEFGMPVGFRKELANVRNSQFKLALQRTRIEELEMDMTRELTQVLRATNTNYELAKAHFNRWAAATTEVDSVLANYRDGKGNLDTVLESQRRRSTAQIAYYQALAEYNKAIALVHRRKGTTLDYCGVSFAEGPWTGKAYLDARDHAARRAASREMSYAFTRPEVVSRGTMGRPAGTLYHGEVYQEGEVIQGQPTPVDQAAPGSELESLPSGASPSALPGLLRQSPNNVPASGNPQARYLPPASSRSMTGSVVRGSGQPRNVDGRSSNYATSSVGRIVGSGVQPVQYRQPASNQAVNGSHYRAAGQVQSPQANQVISNTQSKTYRPRRKTVARIQAN